MHRPWYTAMKEWGQRQQRQRFLRKHKQQQTFLSLLKQQQEFLSLLILPQRLFLLFLSNNQLSASATSWAAMRITLMTTATSTSAASAASATSMASLIHYTIASSTRIAWRIRYIYIKEKNIIIILSGKIIIILLSGKTWIGCAVDGTVDNLYGTTNRAYWLTLCAHLFKDDDDGRMVAWEYLFPSVSNDRRWSIAW